MLFLLLQNYIHISVNLAIVNTHSIDDGVCHLLRCVNCIVYIFVVGAQWSRTFIPTASHTKSRNHTRGNNMYSVSIWRFICDGRQWLCFWVCVNVSYFCGFGWSVGFRVIALVYLLSHPAMAKRRDCALVLFNLYFLHGRSDHYVVLICIVSFIH